MPIYLGLANSKAGADDRVERLGQDALEMALAHWFRRAEGSALQLLRMVESALGPEAAANAVDRLQETKALFVELELRPNLSRC